MMNKKLFAILASAAMMASFAPSVFAEANDAPESAAATTESAVDTTDSTAPVSNANMTLTVSAPKSAAAGEKVGYDVYLTSDVHVESVLFNFVVEGAEVVDFVFDGATTAELGFSDVDWNPTASPEFVEQGGADNQVYLSSMDFNNTSIPNNSKLGTLYVKAGNVGDTIKVSTINGLGNYDYGEEVAIGDTAASDVTVTDEAPESSSSNSETPSTSESASTSESSSKATTNTSSKATNGTTSNTNTGAASTAAVALAASAAALVVISKKRK